MTARIHKLLQFSAGLHFNNKFYINSYDLDLTFNVETESIREQNIALERIKFYVYECLQHCVFVHQNDTDTIEKYTNVGMNVCTLPEEPYDQVIGIMLMTKLNNIMDERLIITDMSIESRMSDGVSCLHSVEENIGPFTEKGWWSDNSQRINTLSNKNKKVVKLSKTKTEWQDVDLDWDDTRIINSEAEIIFTSFDKSDK